MNLQVTCPNCNTEITVEIPEGYTIEKIRNQLNLDKIRIIQEEIERQVGVISATRSANISINTIKTYSIFSIKRRLNQLTINNQAHIDSISKTILRLSREINEIIAIKT
jgi:uncharacterized Zn finger protein (UPF0148 family)